jgi:hypothetical protein
MTCVTKMRPVRLARVQCLIVVCLAACSSDPKSSATPIGQSGSGGLSTAGATQAQGGTTAGSVAVGAGGRAASGAGGTSTSPSTAGRAAASTAGTPAQMPDVTQPTAGMPSTGGSGGNTATAGASGAPTVDMACNPADKKADPKPVEFAKPGEGPGLSPPTGEFKPIMEADPGIPTHTIIRPDPLGKIKHPILAWGEGGCGKSGNIGMFSALFMEFASHGILVVADGPPGTGPTMEGTDAKPLLFAIEWAQKENERPCSQYYHKLDVTKVAVSGQSCGGLMAIAAATDPRITTAFPFDSGLFSRDQTVYDALHAPLAIFDGGDQDIAYANGLADFMAITKIPMLFGNPTSCSSNAHVCTFFDANAGEFGRAGVAWARWHLLNDQGATGKGMFIGDQCGLCGPKWNLMWKMKPQ